ncbi:MAG: acyltransferase family protein [Collinsella sp.]
MLYHLNLTWAQGGLLGVTIFFVLSGYLITRLLINEVSKTGRIDLKSFWIRRIRRLFPAVVTVVVVTCALCTIFNHVMLTKMRPDILPSLLFFNNWWQIAQNVSYFNALGDPSPLTHFWSLAIEEQFYLIWPPLLFAMVSMHVSKPHTRRVVLGLAAVSALAMMVLYNPAADPSRVYYGTDTRVFSLLLGAWMAFIPDRDLAPVRLAHRLGLNRLAGAAKHGKNAEGKPGEKADEAAETAPAQPSALVRFWSSPASIDVLGVVGLVGLAAMVALTNGYTAFQYRGGTLLCSILTLMVIAACVQPQGMVARALSAEPLVWVGKRSYSIYLWHYPLLLLMNPVANINDTPWWQYILQVLLVVAVASAAIALSRPV